MLFGEKVCTGFSNYVEITGSLKEERRGKGCFSHIYYVLNYVDKKSLLPCRCYGYRSDHCVGACEQENKRGWRAQCSFLQLSMTLHRVLWSRGCPRPLPSPRPGTQECCDCKVFCWLAQHEENFLGHELESREVLCTSPPRRCYQYCCNTHAPALPQRQATGAMEKDDVLAGPMPALCLGCDGFPLV